MLHVVTLLWDANEHSLEFSRGYDERWVERLFRGFKRNLRRPFRFVCFTEREREFNDQAIEQERLSTDRPSYANCIEPYRLNEPMILVGLDTVIVGNVDHFGDYCLGAKIIALPLNPKKPSVSCNGVAFVPAGNRAIFDEWRGENDMAWVIGRKHALIDQLWPGQVRSFKVHVRKTGLGDARIVYFHGAPKIDEVAHLEWVKDHWLRGE